MVEAPSSDDATESPDTPTDSHNCAEKGSWKTFEDEDEKRWVCAICSEHYLDRGVAFTLSMDSRFSGETADL